MRCPTTSGSFQCDREQGHAGECECTPEASTPAGPAGANGRASTHIRAMLDAFGPAGLDRLGDALGVRRTNGEPDVDYRERIWAAR